VFAISRLGFGAWAMGGVGWAYSGTPEHDEESLAALRRALDGGVTWVDTAPTYGRGHSEELVGRLRRELGGARPLVFTKCGRRWDAPGAKPYSDLSPAALRATCEASLRRLGIDSVDLLQIHWPGDVNGVPIEESWGAMRRLVEEGKARAAGVCNFDADLLARCQTAGPVDSLQIPISLIVRDATAGLLDYCAAHGIGVLAYSPMQVGLLTDSFTAARVAELDAEDWRRTYPLFTTPLIERNLALRDALRPIARAHGTSVGAVAVAWVLSRTGVTGAIVGASSAAQVEGWVGAGDLRLTPEDHTMIVSALRDTGAGSGPLPEN
jgi:aryl-alcohol dehydrogenase-like predicted oxidoreductase